MNKKPDIANLLDRPHLGGHQDTETLPPDPAIRTRISVTIDNVVPFNRNPRRSRNPLYEEIKESIRNKGLDHPPIVTRKSPSDPYMIKKGGNTRLSILKELWEETQEPRFYRIDCDFEPWTSDLDNLISHMVENEMKGGTLFIEKAIGAVEIKMELEAAASEPISVRELARRITAEGWSLDPTVLSALLYAHESLFPVIPEAFWSGMGRDTVKKIRKLLETCKTFWESVAKPEEGSFDDIWKPTLSAMDGEGFDVDKAEYQLCSAMSEKLDSPVMAVRAEVQAIHEGISKGGNRPTDIIRAQQPNPAVKKNSEVSQTKHPKPTPGSGTGIGSRAPNPEISAEKLDELQSEHGATSQAAQYQGQAFQQEFRSEPARASNSDAPFGYLLDFEVSSLQELSYQAALDYADTYGIAELVEYIDIPDTWHVGYRMNRPEGIGQSDNLLLPWVLLWSLSNALTPPAEVFGQLDSYLTDTLTKDALLLILALLPNFKGQLAGRQIQDPNFEPVRWKTLTELEAIIALLVDYRMNSPEKLFASSLDEEVM